MKSTNALAIACLIALVALLVGWGVMTKYPSLPSGVDKEVAFVPAQWIGTDYSDFKAEFGSALGSCTSGLKVLLHEVDGVRYKVCVSRDAVASIEAVPSSFQAWHPY